MERAPRREVQGFARFVAAVAECNVLTLFASIFRPEPSLASVFACVGAAKRVFAADPQVIFTSYREFARTRC